MFHRALGAGAGRRSRHQAEARLGSAIHRRSARRLGIFYAASGGRRAHARRPGDHRDEPDGPLRYAVDAQLGGQRWRGPRASRRSSASGGATVGFALIAGTVVLQPLGCSTCSSTAPDLHAWRGRPPSWGWGCGTYPWVAMPLELAPHLRRAGVLPPADARTGITGDGARCAFCSRCRRSTGSGLSPTRGHARHQPAGVLRVRSRDTAAPGGWGMTSLSRKLARG